MAVWLECGKGGARGRKGGRRGGQKPAHLGKDFGFDSKSCGSVLKGQAWCVL